MKSPDNNPKTAQGAKKAQLHLVPPIAIAKEAEAFADGADKYGPYNWRSEKVSASVYYSAARRHLDAWWDGQNHAPDNGVHHLGAVRASMAIILDAMACEMFNDDRPLARIHDAPPAIIQQPEGPKDRCTHKWIKSVVGSQSFCEHCGDRQ